MRTAHLCRESVGPAPTALNPSGAPHAYPGATPATLPFSSNGINGSVNGITSIGGIAGTLRPGSGLASCPQRRASTTPGTMAPFTPLLPSPAAPASEAKEALAPAALADVAAKPLMEPLEATQPRPGLPAWLRLHPRQLGYGRGQCPASSGAVGGNGSNGSLASRLAGLLSGHVIGCVAGIGSNGSNARTARIGTKGSVSRA